MIPRAPAPERPKSYVPLAVSWLIVLNLETSAEHTRPNSFVSQLGLSALGQKDFCNCPQPPTRNWSKMWIAVSGQRNNSFGRPPHHLDRVRWLSEPFAYRGVLASELSWRLAFPTCASSQLILNTLESTAARLSLLLVIRPRLIGVVCICRLVCSSFTPDGGEPGRPLNRRTAASLADFGIGRPVYIEVIIEEPGEPLQWACQAA